MADEKKPARESTDVDLANAVDSVWRAIQYVGEAIYDLSENVGKIAEKIEELSIRMPDSLVVSSDEPKAEPPSTRPAPRPPPSARPSRTASKGAHGGSRRASISKGVDDMIRTGWLVKKPQDEIVSKLQERFPGANSDNVLHVLKRRLNKSLVRIRVGKVWMWSVIEA